MLFVRQEARSVGTIVDLIYNVLGGGGHIITDCEIA